MSVFSLCVFQRSIYQFMCILKSVPPLWPSCNWSQTSFPLLGYVWFRDLYISSCASRDMFFFCVVRYWLVLWVTCLLLFEFHSLSPDWEGRYFWCSLLWHGVLQKYLPNPLIWFIYMLWCNLDSLYKCGGSWDWYLCSGSFGNQCVLFQWISTKSCMKLSTQYRWCNYQHHKHHYNLHN